MSDKLYDILNKIQRWLPSVGLLYVGVCKIWNMPFGDKINDTIVLIASFMAATLEIASSTYNKEKLK